MLSFRRVVCAVCLCAISLFAQQERTPRPQQSKKEVEQEKASKGTLATPAKAETAKPPDPFSAPTFNGLKLRLIGPAVISGRVVAFAVNPHKRAEYYVAAASGGVWKTDNDGTTWTPVFDHEGSYSIGTVVLDPKDSSTVWVGSGENNSQRSVSYGDGVYKSEDGGKSWKNLGLKRSEHIGRIVFDPRDSKTVYVAAQGPLWGPGGDRGLYKTTDGGQTWKNVLSISENTGVADVVIDPDNPDTLYAAAWQRRRHVWTLIDGGPESALYKTTDGGATWTKLKSGLPSGDLGRIGLAIAPTDSNMIYATIEAGEGKGGIFRSTDHGATWERRSPYHAQPMYYSQLAVDPKNAERVYAPDFMLQVSDDGGKNWHALGEKSKHVDNHVIYIDPDDTSYYLVGCDGGVYESYDRGANWKFMANLPLGQFYDVAVDMAKPIYNVYGGTQDNSSWGGPSRTRSLSGIVNSDWFQTHGGDGFRSQVDPEDPNTVYAELQHGNLVRYDRRTGEAVGIQPEEGKDEAPLRWNWDSPILISPHSHTRLYFAANKLFRSDDRGDSWREISGDLTRQIDRDQLPVMGKIWTIDAIAKNQSTSFYGNIVALNESPKKDGLIYVGTDDGLIQVTPDGGQNWIKYEKFPGVPERTYVSRLLASNHDANVVYASFDNHKNEDFKPYLLKSTDQGKNWTSIASNLPENGTVLAIAEDRVNPNLLFAGTEFGLYFTIDGGQKWIQLKGDFPTIAVRDLVLHPRENDLVVATFGRSIYILDDITPLRALKPEMLSQPAQLYPVKDAWMFIQSRPEGGRGKAHLGESFYTADNAPYGATFTYYLKDKLKTKKELRQDAEKAAEKAGKVPPYPSHEQMRIEAQEEAPQIFFVVSDESGKPVRRVNATNATGFQRVSWDLRYSTPVLPQREESEGDEDFGPPSFGPLVMPGKYSVHMYKKQDGTVTELGQPQTFQVYTEDVAPMRPQDRAALHDFQQKVASLYRAVAGSTRAGQEMKTRLTQIRRALNETPTADKQLAQTTDRIDRDLSAVMMQLSGDRVVASLNDPTPPSISGRVGDIMSGERFSSAVPTKTHQDAYAIAAQEFAAQLAKLQQLSNDMAQLEKQLEAAGAPWTPGRIPTWQEQ